MARSDTISASPCRSIIKIAAVKTATLNLTLWDHYILIQVHLFVFIIGWPTWKLPALANNYK